MKVKAVKSPKIASTVKAMVMEKVSRWFGRFLSRISRATRRAFSGSLGECLFSVLIV